MPVYKLNYTIMDDKRQKSRHGFYINYTSPEPDIASVVAYAQAYAAELDDVILGMITNISLTLEVALPDGISTGPDANSDVEEGRMMVYRTEGGFPFTHRIPTFDEELIEEVVQVGIVSLPSSVLQLVSLITNPLDAPEEWPVDPCDSRGDRITLYVRSEEDFKASRSS